MANHWRKDLTAPIVLNGGTRLNTFLEAGEFIDANCRTLDGAALQYTIELLMQAAETGSVYDRNAATEQLRSFLSVHRWL